MKKRTCTGRKNAYRATAVYPWQKGEYMNTRTVLDSLPENVRDHIEELKKYELDTPIVRRVAKASYVRGLADAGLITDVERRILYTYMTV